MEPPPDQLFEITETSLAAVSPRTPAAAKQEVFIERLLQVSPTGPNFLKAEPFRDALLRLSPVNGRRGGRNPGLVNSALVIPDYAVRMAVLDFEEFPAGEEERSSLVKFRLRKSVPFPIDEAQVSYAIQWNEAKRIEVLAVTIARPILEEYEALFMAAGFRVGLVTPSSIAILPLCYSAEPGLTLLAKYAGSTLSVLLLEHSRARLVRCLDLAQVDSDGADEADLSVLPILEQTFAYAEDQLGQPVKRLLLSGFGESTDAVGSLAETEFGTPYALVRSRFGAATPENAGILGLLEQYAA